MRDELKDEIRSSNAETRAVMPHLFRLISCSSLSKSPHPHMSWCQERRSRQKTKALPSILPLAVFKPPPSTFHGQLVFHPIFRRTSQYPNMLDACIANTGVDIPRRRTRKCHVCQRNRHTRGRLSSISSAAKDKCKIVKMSEVLRMLGCTHNCQRCLPSGISKHGLTCFQLAIALFLL